MLTTLGFTFMLTLGLMGVPLLLKCSPIVCTVAVMLHLADIAYALLYTLQLLEATLSEQNVDVALQERDTCKVTHHCN
jgi:hypothetical protein